MKKIPVWKNAVLIGSALMVVVIATFAWFYTRPNTDMGGISVDVGKGTFIQISGDGGNKWSEELDVEIGMNKSFKEISGDGISFFAPVYDFVSAEDGTISTQIISFEDANEKGYYYEQTIDLRADTAQSVYLAPESYVTAVGDGCIDGAIRVAFFEIDAEGNETLKLVWAPNSTVEYSADTNSYNRNGSVEEYYYYQKSLTPVDFTALEETTDDVAMISTEGTDDNGCGYNEDYLFMWSNGENLPENLPSILSVDNSGEDNYFYNQVKIRVWLEGYDRECVSLLSGQRFIVKLQFTAREVE